MTALPIDIAMARHEGVAHIQDLLGEGFTRHQVAALHRSGRITRARIGWYVSPSHHPSVVRAVRAGGILDCVSAADSFGLDVPADHRVHVALPPNAARLRSTQNGFRRVAAGEDPHIVRHWGTIQDDWRYRVGLVDCLRTVLGCLGTEWAVGVVDSALRPGPLGPKLTSDQLVMLRRSLPADKRRTLAQCSGRAESILESVARVRLQAAGLNPVEQVPVGPYRVDFLIDGWLVIECDGRTHAEKAQFANDRSRDAYFARAGLRVLRFTYAQIVHGWLEVLTTILSVLTQGRPRS